MLTTAQYLEIYLKVSQEWLARVKENQEASKNGASDWLKGFDAGEIVVLENTITMLKNCQKGLSC